ncbi:uncharacterized protein LOC128983501 [Macrosteles quadrilineatus]|uniref:uncharacterized protein LOC128983501 n=1 Tax=Macrosteles quadrilineatus TaxID=74068 RepID=UPI0023E2A84F|nr:uncharacterized protein LOC128983501 [Macrosteles quadrilineatus]
MANGKDVQVCPACKNVVLDSDDAVECEFFCKKWYHCACVDINNEEYVLMSQLAEKSKWACNTCELRLGKIITKVSDFDSLIDLHATVINLITVVKEVVSDNIAIKDKLDQLTKPLSQDRPRTNEFRGGVNLTSAILSPSDLLNKDQLSTTGKLEDSVLIVDNQPEPVSVNIQSCPSHVNEETNIFVSPPSNRSYSSVTKSKSKVKQTENVKVINNSAPIFSDTFTRVETRKGTTRDERMIFTV